MQARPESTVEWAHPIQAVAFDMDGLLVNTEDLYTQVGTKILERRGKIFSRELKNAMTGLPGPEAFQIMIDWHQLADPIETLAVESQQIFAELLPNQLEALLGVTELLDFLEQRRMPKCVATSSTPSFAQKVLTQVGIIKRFDFILTASEVQRGKPHPDIYQEAARRMSISTSQLLVLEDSHHGCRAGVSSGACTIAVPGDHSLDHDFSGAFQTARTLSDPIIYQTLRRT